MANTQIRTLLDRLAEHIPAEPAVICADRTQTGNLPAVGGAYLLIVRLDHPLKLPLKRLRQPELAAGDYVYAGSAYGRGGIRARVARHMRTEKTPHWHVDHLTDRAAAMAAVGLPGAGECQLVSTLNASGDLFVAADGFGSSDCRACAGHLLVYRPES